MYIQIDPGAGAGLFILSILPQMVGETRPYSLTFTVTVSIAASC